MFSSKFLRWILASVCLLTVLVGVVLAWCNSSGKGGADELPFTEPLQKAVEIRIEWSGKNAEIAILLIAALWGLVLAGKDEVRLSKMDRPEWLMFASANLLLGAAFFVHQRFTNAVANALVDAVRIVPGGKDLSPKVPDVFGPLFQWGYTLEIWLLLLGMVAGITTLISTVYLKKT